MGKTTDPVLGSSVALMENTQTLLQKVLAIHSVSTAKIRTLDLISKENAKIVVYLRY